MIYRWFIETTTTTTNPPVDEAAQSAPEEKLEQAPIDDTQTIGYRRKVLEAGLERARETLAAHESTNSRLCGPWTKRGERREYFLRRVADDEKQLAELRIEELTAQVQALEDQLRQERYTVAAVRFQAASSAAQWKKNLLHEQESHRNALRADNDKRKKERDAANEETAKVSQRLVNNEIERRHERETFQHNLAVLRTERKALDARAREQDGMIQRLIGERDEAQQALKVAGEYAQRKIAVRDTMINELKARQQQIHDLLEGNGVSQ